MKIEDSEHSDDLREEYDFYNLEVVSRGPGRAEEITVSLAPDVAAVFPDSEAVNGALRLLMKLARDQARAA